VKVEEILIEGSWQAASATESFRATNPATGKDIEHEFPVSTWEDCDRALAAAHEASERLRTTSGEQLGDFLEAYAEGIEARADEIIARANAETALPITPRLRSVELPRTTAQLRQAAAAAREGSWTQAVIDTKNNIRSHFAPIGPVAVFGPNNFPLAFNGVSGGDFAAAVASGNPVIAKAHPLHPGTSKLLAECAVKALRESGLPSATLQMIYHCSKEDGLLLVADRRLGATSFTGSRSAGLHLKAAAEGAGKPIYLEMSSLNPIVLLPGSLRERGEALTTETADSALAASGQFCTSPNLVFLIESPEALIFAQGLARIYDQRTPSPLLSDVGRNNLDKGVRQLRNAGAATLTATSVEEIGNGFCYGNTVLQTTASNFLTEGESLQQEAFGNAITLVVARDRSELLAALESLEGNLAGSIYSSTTGEDDELYGQVASVLRSRVGRLLNDKMPTGVALSPAMNHGGPFPSTGHPGFTAVGIPRSMIRFGALHCYDGVRPLRLPPALRDVAPNSMMWRQIDGQWVRG
jgi:alpha-ketoglutaric semialdehyde dehydrogenase